MSKYLKIEKIPVTVKTPEGGVLRVKEYLYGETEGRTFHLQLIEDGTIGLLSKLKEHGLKEMMRFRLDSFDALLLCMLKMRRKISKPFNADFRFNDLRDFNA